MPELAKRIRYEPRTGKFEIDGKEFPWYLTEDGVSGRSARKALTMVSVEIPCEHFEIVDTAWLTGNEKKDG